MKVGESVFAIGNPHGLGWSHTQGVISQLRTRNSLPPIRIIQTQAAINPGNSGGGLYDQEGYLLGINTWTADKRVSEGIGFAIALDTLSTWLRRSWPASPRTRPRPRPRQAKDAYEPSNTTQHTVPTTIIIKHPP